MKHLLPLILLVVLATGCRKSPSAAESLVPPMEGVPTISKVEVPVFSNNEATKSVQAWAVQHNASLASFELLKENKIEEGMRLFAEGQRYFFSIPDLVPMHRVPALLSDKEKTTFSKFFREMNEESEPMTKWLDDFMQKNPEAKAQYDTLLNNLNIQ